PPPAPERVDRLREVLLDRPQETAETIVAAGQGGIGRETPHGSLGGGGGGGAGQGVAGVGGGVGGGRGGRGGGGRGGGAPPGGAGRGGRGDAPRAGLDPARPAEALR